MDTVQIAPLIREIKAAYKNNEITKEQYDSLIGLLILKRFNKFIDSRLQTYINRHIPRF